MLAENGFFVVCVQLYSVLWEDAVKETGSLLKIKHEFELNRNQPFVVCLF